MNKVINISLAGQVFTLEEPAYNKLSGYLEKLQSLLSDEEDADEIINDIEQRIADLFAEKTYKNFERSFTEEDVDEVIAVLGSPEEIAGKESSQEEKSETEDEKVFTHLMRDPENRYIGGICGGLGVHFKIDPLLFRVLFIALVIPYTVGILVYLVMWLIVPSPKDEAQKTYMKNRSGKIRKRTLFRDPTNKVFGGVCGGIGNYLRVDPVWFRLLAVVFVILYGAGVLIYIALWILMPIPQNQEERTHFKRRSAGYSPKKKPKILKTEHGDIAWQNKTRSFLNNSGPVLNIILNWALLVIGIVATFVFTVTYLMYMFEMLTIYEDFTPSNEILTLTGLLLVTVIPALAVFFAGFNRLYSHKAFNIKITYPILIWICGAGLAIWGGYNNYDGLSKYEHQRTYNISDKLADENLTLKVHEEDPDIDGSSYYDFNFSIFWGLYSYSYFLPENQIMLNINADSDIDSTVIYERIDGNSRSYRRFMKEDIPNIAPDIKDSTITFRTAFHEKNDERSRIANFKGEYIFDAGMGQTFTIDSSINKFYQVSMNDESFPVEKYANTTWQVQEDSVVCIDCREQDITYQNRPVISSSDSKRKCCDVKCPGSHCLVGSSQLNCECHCKGVPFSFWANCNTISK